MMKSNFDLMLEVKAQMNPGRAKDMARLDALKAEHASKRTGYAIQMTGTKLWVGYNNHYHEERSEARSFDFMTTALAFAITLGLEPESFSVEAV